MTSETLAIGSRLLLFAYDTHPFDRSLKTGKEAVLRIIGGDAGVQSMLQDHREFPCLDIDGCHY